MISCFNNRPMVLPSPKSASTKYFNHSSGLLSFLFLCLVHNPHPPSAAGSSSSPAGFSARSSFCPPLLVMFSASLAFPTAMHVLPGVMHIWSVKPTQFGCETERCWISTGGFSLAIKFVFLTWKKRL